MFIKIGTRGSKLALAQASYVKDTLQAAFPQHQFDLVVVKTKGDLNQHTPLHKMEERGVFVKAIETKLLNHEIDIAIHSMKDMPSTIPNGLCLCNAWKGEDARDVLVLHPQRQKHLPQIIATGSIRRKALMKMQDPNIAIVDIRGNVDSRMEKMMRENYDGLILAAAGLHRLKMHDNISSYFDPTDFIPACTQGILAIEIRETDHALKAMIDSFQDEETMLRAESEITFLATMGGSCQMPMGAYLKVEQTQICLYGMLGKEDGTCVIKGNIQGSYAQAKELGEQLAKQLLEQVKMHHG